MTPRRGVACIVLLAMLPACAGGGDAARRFAAERARWHVERVERRAGPPEALSESVRAELRRRHAQLADRFGPERALPAGAAVDPEARRRCRIAGASALRAAELAPRETPDTERRSEFAAIAERYAFDPEIAVRAHVEEGLALEREGDLPAALDAYGRALARQDAPSDTASGWERLLADVELHVVLRTREAESAAEATAAASSARARLTSRAERHAGRPDGRWIRRRLAEVCAASGDGETAAAILADLLATALATTTGSDEAAELAVRLGEVQELLLDRPDEAEVLYRRAGSEAAGRPAGTDARLHLAGLLRAKDRARDATDVYALVIAAAVAADDPARAEALHGRGRCWESLGRWEDAIPAFLRGAEEEGPFALACAARLSLRFRDMDHPEAAGTMRAFATRAELASRSRPPARTLLDWAAAVRRQREARAWAEVLDELAVVAGGRGGSDVPDLASRARTRILQNGWANAPAAP